MGKRKWLALLVLLGAAFITFTVIGRDKSLSDDVINVEKDEEIVPYFEKTTPGLELAMKFGDYQALNDMTLPDDFNIILDGIWYSRYNVYVYYHVDVSDSEFVLTRDRKDLPTIDQLVVEDASGQATVLKVADTEDGVLFENDYYMKGTFQSIVNSETNEPVQEWHGAIKGVVSGKRTASIDVPVSYQYENEPKNTKQINVTKKFDETTITALRWEETPSDSRLILEVSSPFSRIVTMDMLLFVRGEEVEPLQVEELSGQTVISFPSGTELPNEIYFKGLIGLPPKEVSFAVDPNQYEIYKRIKESTYTHQLHEPIASIYGSDFIKDTLFYNEDGVTFNLLVNSMTSSESFVNMKYKKQIEIEAVNEKGEKRNPRLLQAEQDRIVFMIDRGFYERSESIQVQVSQLPVYMKIDWIIKPPIE
ncbi:hypothetical protein [Bacillus sp. RAR_GA_16]|uniref:hypothetical protein n=1 Tax=Bacillus sp. RAR_GA_16 TaxID=2876774 RepID=UPI001CC9A55A|nr:hypothetical protein [Bacillus sp. RAR_GA_16]MCA0170773.1 hypothetical protein [Bacillus sp. RAR_GA_16]